MESSTLQVPSALNQLRAVRQHAEAWALEHGFNEQEAKDIGLCVHEALTNAIVHGNRLDSSKTVYIRFTVTEEGLCISIRDEGLGYDVSQALRQIEGLEAADQPRGRGLLLMMKLMDQVAFEHNGREIHLRKKRPR